MNKEQCKSKILEVVSDGEVWYPSDIASKFRIDYELVVESVEELISEKKIEITENPEDE
jgi:hypothetical protein